MFRSALQLRTMPMWWCSCRRDDYRLTMMGPAAGAGLLRCLLCVEHDGSLNTIMGLSLTGVISGSLERTWHDIRACWCLRLGFGKFRQVGQTGSHITSSELSVRSSSVTKHNPVIRLSILFVCVVCFSLSGSKDVLSKMLCVSLVSPTRFNYPCP